MSLASTCFLGAYLCRLCIKPERGLVQLTQRFCFDTYAASLDVISSGFFPVVVFVCRSPEYSRYCFPSLSDLRTTSAHRSSLCSLHPRKRKCSVLFNQTVLTRACGELNSSTLLLRKNIDLFVASSCGCFGFVALPLSLQFFRFCFKGV